MRDRPKYLRPVFTTGYYDLGPIREYVYPDGMRESFEKIEPFASERLRASKKGPVFHAGRPVRIRPVWKGDDGLLRLGRTDDMIQMMTDMKVRITA